MIRITSLFLLLLMTSLSFAQEAGDEDLEAAFELKIKAEKLGDYEEVVKLCKSAIEKGLDDDGENEAKTLAGAALFEQAEQLMIRIRKQRGDPTFFRNQAVKFLNEAVEFDPEMGEAWLLISKLNLLPGGDAEEAISAVDRSISLLDGQPRKRSEAYLLRSVLTQKDDREGSREDLDKSIELFDGNVSALRTPCTIQILAGDIEEGLEDSDKIIELNDGNLGVLALQGDSLTKLADAKATAAFRLGLAEENEDDSEDEDDDESPEQSKDELEADAKQVREAVLDIYDKAIKLAPENENFYLLKIDTLRVLKKTDEALTAVDELIKRDDQSVKALQKKAQILLLEEDNDEQTVEVLDLAVKIDPYDMSTRRLRMRFFSAKSQFSEAVKEAEKILEKEPDNTDIMDQLGRLYSIDQQPKKAIEIFGGLLNRMPGSLVNQIPPRSRPIFLARKIGVLRSRGDSYLSTGEHENAIEDYELALELGEQIEELQASLADPGFEYSPDDGVLNNLAWVLATSTGDDLRDGKRAIELATLACEVTDYEAPHILSTLASAYAETGDFDEAIKWIEKGLEVNEEREITDLLPEEEIERQRASLQKELDSYRDKKPWRENQAEEEAARMKAEKEKKEKAKKKKKKSKDKDDDEEDSDDEDEEDK